jgi:hypothetical protein
MVTVETFRLMEAHQRVDEEILLESGRRRPDGLRLMRLKRLKLRLKDALNGLLPPRARPKS